MELRIHVSKNQVFALIPLFGKVVKNPDGTTGYDVPEWIRVMWEYASER